MVFPVKLNGLTATAAPMACVFNAARLLLRRKVAVRGGCGDDDCCASYKRMMYIELKAKRLDSGGILRSAGHCCVKTTIKLLYMSIFQMFWQRISSIFVALLCVAGRRCGDVGGLRNGSISVNAQ